MSPPPSPTPSDSSLHLYTPLVLPVYFQFLDDLLIIPSPALRIFMQASLHVDLANMSIINTGASLYFSQRDPRPGSVIRRSEPASNDLRFLEILDIRSVDGDVQARAKSVNGMVAWHDFSRFDVETLNTLLANFFSLATAGDISRYINLVRDSLNPPASLIIGVYYLKFTMDHLASAGSPRLSRQQLEWDALVDHLFEGKLRNPNFDTNYTPVRRSPRVIATSSTPGPFFQLRGNRKAKRRSTATPTPATASANALTSTSAAPSGR
ncbi:hypothetical protein JCM8097_009539 [Rhodosporidiobolus ruineniae]